VGGLNTLGHAPSRTLSGHTELCPARPLCPWKDNILETWKNLNFADCNATKHLYIVYNIYIYIIMTWSSSNHYINMTMFSATCSIDHENPIIYNKNVRNFGFKNIFNTQPQMQQVKPHTENQ
jgi:hypothetical protein